MSGPVVVISPAELRSLVREAVREALDADRRERAPDPGAWLDTAGASELLGVHPRTVTKSGKGGRAAVLADREAVPLPPRGRARVP